MIRVYADGSLAATCIVPEGGEPIILPFVSLFAEGTTNEAEYSALWQALCWVLQQDIGSFEILMDSQLIVYQVNGIYKAANGKMFALKDRASRELRWLRETGYHIELKWIRREENLAGKVLE